MSHTLTLNKELGVIVLRAKQTMSFGEIGRVFGEMVHLPGFKAGLCLVADFRGSGTTMTGDDIRQLVKQAVHTDDDWGVTKWSIIASDDLLFGLSRMFSSLTVGHLVNTHVFRSVLAADDWMDLGVGVEQILERTPDH